MYKSKELGKLLANSLLKSNIIIYKLPQLCKSRDRQHFIPVQLLSTCVYTHIHTDIHADRHTYTQTDRQTHSHIYIHRQHTHIIPHDIVVVINSNMETTYQYSSKSEAAMTLNSLLVRTMISCTSGLSSNKQTTNIIEYTSLHNFYHFIPAVKSNSILFFL